MAKGKRKTRRKKSQSHIEDRTAFVAMMFLGIIFIITGFFSDSINIFLKETNVTNYFYIILSMVAFLVTIFELGIKRFSNLSQLERFNAQQLVTFTIAIMVVVSSILRTVLPDVTSLAYFNAGIFVAQGLTVIAEAIT